MDCAERIQCTDWDFPALLLWTEKETGCCWVAFGLGRRKYMDWENYTYGAY